MNKFNYDDGMIYINNYENNYEFSLDSLVELLDMISDLEDTEIVDVDIDPDGYSVTCTFADGEKQTAHCHPEDYDNWSLETGISVCLGKYLTGGSNQYNRIVHHGVKVFKDKLNRVAKELEACIEEERIRENKRRKHERYLKRRDERRKAEAEAHHKQDKDKSTEDTIIDILNKIAFDMGLKVEIEVVKV